MIQFLLTGILRDKQRSLLPIIVVATGAFLVVFLSAWIGGILGDMIKLNANFTTGHVKVMTKAYAENIAQKPNDLALLDISDLKGQLSKDYPDVDWIERISFGGLMDVADENGETLAQGPAAGMAIDLLSKDSKELDRMNIRNSLVRGRLPQAAGEALMSEEFATKLNMKMDGEITLFGSTMEGSMAFKNFIIVGTVRFGTGGLDRGAVVVDIRDAQEALDMVDAASELLGYFGETYHNGRAKEMAATFNAKNKDDKDEFAPIMLALTEQNNLEEMFSQTESMSFILIFIFVFAMSIVLWNTGLLGGLRRYGEFGLRLALGEEKKHIYKTLIYEAILIGAIGSLIGTLLGLGLSYYVQINGIDFSALMKNNSMMMPSVFRTMITPMTFFIGFIPGVFSMVLGNALSGIGIYKRETASLFKELEV